MKFHGFRSIIYGVSERNIMKNKNIDITELLNIIDNYIDTTTIEYKNQINGDWVGENMSTLEAKTIVTKDLIEKVNEIYLEKA